MSEKAGTGSCLFVVTQKSQSQGKNREETRDSVFLLLVRQVIFIITIKKKKDSALRGLGEVTLGF